jgi:RNA polymerase sigma-70 factor, ECF subfamily
MNNVPASQDAPGTECGREAGGRELADAPPPSWQHGDPAAFVALVRRWQQPVARFLAAIIGRDDRVPDLCQEVFLRVFLARSRYRETGAFSSWLYRIALNVARDACRRRRPPMHSLADQEFRAADPGAESRCQQQELSEAIAAGLAHLPLKLREVVVLRHYEHLNFKDMAQMLGIPPSTLRSRFELGMGQLRAFLKQRGWSP